MVIQGECQNTFLRVFSPVRLNPINQIHLNELGDKGLRRNNCNKFIIKKII